LTIAVRRLEIVPFRVASMLVVVQDPAVVVMSLNISN
jgi:hypothetical protein